MFSQKRVFKTVFIIQIIAAFLVFAGHYTAGIITFRDGGWETALNHLSRYGTVFLAIITGYFTAHSLTKKQSSTWEFFKGKVFYIFIPFLIFGIIYHYFLIGGIPSTLVEWKNIFLGKTGGHMYFVFMLLQYYIFAYLFRSFLTKKTLPFFIMVFLGIQYLFIGNNITFAEWGLGVRFFLPTWLFTIYMGHILYSYQEKVYLTLKKYKSFALLVIVLALASSIYFTFSSNLYTANHLRFVISSLVLLRHDILTEAYLSSLSESATWFCLFN